MGKGVSRLLAAQAAERIETNGQQLERLVQRFSIIQMVASWRTAAHAEAAHDQGQQAHGAISRQTRQAQPGRVNATQSQPAASRITIFNQPLPGGDGAKEKGELLTTT